MARRLVAVKCKLFQGIFPSERYFEVVMANGEKHRGVSPRHFCWNSQGFLVQEEEPTDGVAGFIAAKLIVFDLPKGLLAVEVPDGEVLATSKEIVTERPTEIFPPGHASTVELELPGYVSN